MIQSMNVQMHFLTVSGVLFVWVSIITVRDALAMSTPKSSGCLDENHKGIVGLSHGKQEYDGF